MSELSSLPETPIDNKQTPEQKEQEVFKKFLPALNDKNSTSSSRSRRVKQSEADENMEKGLDLQVLSSFDCVKSIPTALLDYISTMFRNEYGQSHKDFHSEYIIAETIPLLEKLNINCGAGQNCSALFQYDKQYGLNTTSDNTYPKENVFYCCPSVHNWTNETISEVCKRAQKIAGKSIFRESRDPTFLERVTKLTTHVITERLLSYPILLRVSYTV